MRPAGTTASDVAEAATFTVFSASTGKMYACGVPVDVAAASTRHYGGHPDELLELELFDSWQSFPDTRGIAVMRIT
jgi:hypothetical protein